MRPSDTAHTSRAWRIQERTRDFRLEDVWALPAPGGPHDPDPLVRQIAAGHTSTTPSRMQAARDRLEHATHHVRGVACCAQALGALTSAMAVSSRSASSGRQITRSGR